MTAFHTAVFVGVLAVGYGWLRVAIVVVEFVVFLAGGALTDLVVLVTVLYLEDASVVVERKSLSTDGALTSLLSLIHI